MARSIATVLVVATLVAAPARAADKLEAKERKARVECAAGDYAEGVRLLAELWVATGDATFLYNQGRCYEQSGQNDLAVSRFREYLRKAPALPAEDVQAVNRRIDELQRQAAGRAAPAPTVINLVSPAAPQAQAPIPAAGVDRSAELVSTPRPAPVSDSPVYARWWFWTGVGAVLAGGVATAVLSLAIPVKSRPLATRGCHAFIETWPCVSPLPGCGLQRPRHRASRPDAECGCYQSSTAWGGSRPDGRRRNSPQFRHRVSARRRGVAAAGVSRPAHRHHHPHRSDPGQQGLRAR